MSWVSAVEGCPLSRVPLYVLSVPTVTIIGGLVFLLFAVTAFLHDPTQQQESFIVDQF